MSLASYRVNTSFDNSRSLSRPRYGYDKRSDSRPRRPKTRIPRCSPARQASWPVQVTRPSVTSNDSTHSLNSVIDIPRSVLMERMSSGNSIMSDTPFEVQHIPQLQKYTLTCDDLEAARRVKKLVSSPSSSTKQASRILRQIIMRTDRLDDRALDGVIAAMDLVFFGGKLRGRVQWEWSSQPQYQHDLIGTTALRQRSDGDGYETLILLSEPILTDIQYDRRLLLSAFLHELIHCYIFIMCGFEGRREGGHTEGFHAIAAIVDDWVGGSWLSLCDMRANLENYRVPGTKEAWKDDGIAVYDSFGYELDSTFGAYSPRYVMGQYCEDSEALRNGFYGAVP